MTGTTTLTPDYLCPGAVSVLHRNPHLVDVFPIGAGLADWALWSA